MGLAIILTAKPVDHRFRASEPRARRYSPGSYAWGSAYVFYACMSACGLGYHSVLPEGSLSWGLAYAGDMAFTACSCLSIATGEGPCYTDLFRCKLCGKKIPHVPPLRWITPGRN